MNEYEYSFIVNDLTPYIEYCKKEGFEKIDETTQIRELFTSNNGILARITTNESEGEKKTYLDFKTDDVSDKVLKISKETIPLEVTEENREAIYSMLEILEYNKTKHLNRKRQIYEKSEVKFEIDNYSSPEIMFVVGIEGEKNAVDEIYRIISETINNEIK